MAALSIVASLQKIGIGVRSVNGGVTHGARLVLLRLVMRRPGWSESGIGMALQTKQIHLTDAQKTRVGRSVRGMATRTAFGLDRHVLVQERALFFRVAAEAGGITARRFANLPQARSAVRVMAVVALDEPFIHAVVIGPGKLRALVRVAGIAKFRLLLHQQVFRFGGMVRAVAIDAPDLIAGMGRARRKMLGLGIAVACQATAARLAPGKAGKADNLAFVPSACDVLAARSVTGLASMALLHGLEMRGLLELILVNGLVTSQAGIRTDVFRPRTRRFRLHLRLSSILILILGPQGKQQHWKGKKNEKAQPGFHKCALLKPTGHAARGGFCRSVSGTPTAALTRAHDTAVKVSTECPREKKQNRYFVTVGVFRGCNKYAKGRLQADLSSSGPEFSSR